jgi:hypothetical protein
MILTAVQPPTRSDPDSDCICGAGCESDSSCHVMLAVRVIVVDSGNSNDGIIYV